MQVKYLLQALERCDPEAFVELRISDLRPPEWNSLERSIDWNNGHRYFKYDDGSYHNVPQSGSEYCTIRPNTILLTNWIMTASYNG